MPEHDWFAQFEADSVPAAPPDVAQEPQGRIGARTVAGMMLPTVTASLASALVPAAGVPARLLPLLRIAAAAPGSVPGTLGRRALMAADGNQAQTPLLQDIGTEAGAQMGGAALGHVVGRGLEGASRRMMGAALRPSVAAQARYKSAVAKMPPDMRATAAPDITTAALKQRVRLGRPDAPLAEPKLQAQMRPKVEAKSDLIAQQEASGVRYSPMDRAIADEISALKAEMASEANPAKMRAQVDKLWRGFIEARRTQSKGARLGKLERLSPRELDAIKQTAQDRAHAVYAAQEGARAGRAGVPSDRQAIEARFNEALARGARKALERNAPDLRRVNAELAPMFPLRDVVRSAELRPEPGVPAQMHTLWGDIRGLIDTPAARSRLALMLSNPGARFMGQALPRAAVPAAEQFMGWPPLAPIPPEWPDEQP